MTKCFVTIALGERHQQYEKLHGASRRGYAERHGYDYRVITEIPETITERASQATPRLKALLTKLAAPGLLMDYDFVLFTDIDTVINPKAPCLSLYAPHIPSGGLGGVQDIMPEERRALFPRWSHDYYTEVEHRGVVGYYPNRDLYINSGLLIYKPAEVRDRWLELAMIPSHCGDENRLNAREVQEGRCLFLPPNWNTIWYFEKFRLGYLTPAKSRMTNGWNMLRNKLALGEKRLAQKTLQSVHMLHFAFEGDKIGLVSQDWNRESR